VRSGRRRRAVEVLTASVAAGKPSHLRMATTGSKGQRNAQVTLRL